MQKLLVVLAGKRVIDLHCMQGVPDQKRASCTLYRRPNPPGKK